MDEPTRARLVEILETAPEIYLPVGRLLQTLQAEGLASGLDRPAFLEALRAEALFELLGSRSGAEPAAGDVEPGVRLVSRALTAEAVMTALAHNLAQLNDALLRAWESRPAGDTETEAMLLEVLARAEDLGKEIQSIADERTDEGVPTPGEP